jgi:hypothetical protein
VRELEDRQPPSKPPGLAGNKLAPVRPARTKQARRGRAGRAYALAVPSDRGAWARVSAGDGAQGPRWCDWACLALPCEAAPGWAHRRLVRRSVSRPAARAYYRVYAPADTTPGAMVRAAGSRWRLETALGEAKERAGLDHDEGRRRDGWHRHVTLALLAHAALVAARATTVGRGKGAAAA